MEFVWPLAVKSVLRGHSGAPAALCFNDGSHCWIADTGCGYRLVPESDINRGVSDIVPNPGAVRLSTANGEVDAGECVRFSLPEIQLRKQLGTILAQTPRVLSVGALCTDEQASFHRPACGTPSFTLHDGCVV